MPKLHKDLPKAETPLGESPRAGRILPARASDTAGQDDWYGRDDCSKSTAIVNVESAVTVISGPEPCPRNPSLGSS
jgi:hypothetical protein